MKQEGIKHIFLKNTDQGQGDESSSPENLTDFFKAVTGKVSFSNPFNLSFPFFF